jgi:hypothetical protein
MSSNSSCVWAFNWSASAWAVEGVMSLSIGCTELGGTP